MLQNVSPKIHRGVMAFIWALEKFLIDELPLPRGDYGQQERVNALQTYNNNPIGLYFELKLRATFSILTHRSFWSFFRPIMWGI